MPSVATRQQVSANADRVEAGTWLSSIRVFPPTPSVDGRAAIAALIRLMSSGFASCTRDPSRMGSLYRGDAMSVGQGNQQAMVANYEPPTLESLVRPPEWWWPRLCTIAWGATCISGCGIVSALRQDECWSVR